MAWVLSARISPKQEWQFTPPIADGVCRVKHILKGEPAWLSNNLKLRIRGLIGIGSNLSGLIQVADIQVLYSSTILEVFRFEPDVEKELSCIGVSCPFNEIENNWKVEIEEWI